MFHCFRHFVNFCVYLWILCGFMRFGLHQLLLLPLALSHTVSMGHTSFFAIVENNGLSLMLLWDTYC